jgi:hypothetical protein
MIVDPGARARQVRKQRAVDLDPGSKIAPKETEYGDTYAQAMRLILDRQRRQAEPEPQPEAKPTVDPFGLPIENGHDTPDEPHERSTPHG